MAFLIINNDTELIIIMTTYCLFLFVLGVLYYLTNPTRAQHCISSALILISLQTIQGRVLLIFLLFLFISMERLHNFEPQVG